MNAENVMLIILVAVALLFVGCEKAQPVVLDNTAKLVGDIPAENETPEPEENLSRTPAAGLCGDGVCGDNETKCSCQKDCGTCEGKAGTCLEFACIKDSCINVKKKDCCGNGICEADEDASGCGEDCPAVDLSDFPEEFEGAEVIVGTEGYNSDPIAALRILNAIGARKGAVRDVKVSSLSNINSVIIGNPCQNTWTKHFYGSLENCADFFEGSGIIKIFNTGNGHYTILVAGKTANDTLDAANILSKSSLTGNEYIVK